MIDYIHALVELRSQYAPWSYITDVVGTLIAIGTYEFLRACKRRRVSRHVNGTPV